MKLAKEIVNELRETFCWGEGSPYPGIAYAIIAAKLEPVREALDRAAHRFEYLYHGGVKERNGIDTLVAARDVRDTIAMFEEE